MTFTAQELNHRVTFEELTYALDSNGDPLRGDQGELLDPVWVEIGEAFAKVEPLVGREFFAAAALQSENTVKFTIRYRDDLITGMRLIHEGDAWDMTSIINIKGRNRETLIMAKKL